MHNQLKEMMKQKPKLKDELIDKLHKGDMFGEIGWLTKLRRTCTVMTSDSSLFLSLDREGMSSIQGEFPSIYNSI